MKLRVVTVRLDPDSGLFDDEELVALQETFDEYWQFHRQRELHRNHLKNYAANDEPRVARAS
jgi:tRNA(His) 5'-end guanylyltransferase